MSGIIVIRCALNIWTIGNVCNTPAMTCHGAEKKRLEKSSLFLYNLLRKVIGCIIRLPSVRN